MEVAPTILWKMRITHPEKHGSQDSAVNRPSGLGRELARRQHRKGKVRSLCGGF